MNLPPSVREIEIAPSYPIFEINHPACTARIALHGATMMSWCPAGGEEVLYLSPDAVFKEGKAIRGGIPLCWPWFNAHPSDPSLPSHGVARTQFWKMDEATEDENGVSIRFSLDDGIWHARVTIRVGAALEISFESLNPGTESIKVAGALHSYFRVGQLDKVRILGLEGADYLDTASTRTREHQEGAVFIDREVDSIYDSSSSVRIIDEALGRTVTIEKTGSPSTVVWNPWVEKAKALADLPDDGYKDFVCVETAIANSKAVTVGAGEACVFSTRISVAARVSP